MGRESAGRRLDSAKAMLNNRSVFISGYWKTFHENRIREEQRSLGRDPQRENNDAPYALAG